MKPSFRSLVVAASLLIASLSQAQGVLWQKTWGIQDNISDRLGQAQPTPDGGFMLTGTSDQGVLAVKTDSRGHSVWRSVYQPPVVAYGGPSVTASAVDADGNAYIAGETYQVNPRQYVSFIEKLRGSDGAEIWRKDFNELFTSTSITQIVPHLDGTLLVGGSQTSSSVTSEFLYRISPTTGDSIGTIPLSISLAKISVLPNGNLIGRTGAHAVSCVAPDGSFLWTMDFTPKFDNQHSIISVTVSPNGRVFMIDNLLGHIGVRRLDASTGRVLWRYEGDISNRQPIATFDAAENPVIAFVFSTATTHGARVMKLGRDGGKVRWIQDLTDYPPAGSNLQGLQPKTLTVTPSGMVFLTTTSGSYLPPYMTAMGVFGFNSSGLLKFGRIDSGMGPFREEPIGTRFRPDGNLLIAGNIMWQNSGSFGAWVYNGFNGKRKSSATLVSRGPATHYIQDAHEAYGLVTVGSTRYSWIFQHQSWDGRVKWKTVVRKSPVGTTTVWSIARMTGSVAYADPKTGLTQAFALGSFDSDCDVVAVGETSGMVAWHIALDKDLIVNQTSLALGGPQSEVCVLGTNNSNGMGRIVRIDRTWGSIGRILDLALGNVYGAKLARASDGNLILLTSNTLYKLNWYDGSILWSRSPSNATGYYAAQIPLDAEGVYTATGDGTGFIVDKVSQADGSLLWSKRFDLTVTGGFQTVLYASNGYVGFVAQDAAQAQWVVRLAADSGESNQVRLPDSTPVESIAFTADGLGYLTGSLPLFDADHNDLGSNGVTSCLDFGAGIVRWSRVLSSVPGSHSYARQVTVTPYGDAVVAGSLGALSDAYDYADLTTICYSKN